MIDDKKPQVVSLAERKAEVDKPKPNKYMIEFLEEMLEAAKEGKLQHITGVLIDDIGIQPISQGLCDVINAPSMHLLLDQLAFEFKMTSIYEMIGYPEE